MAGVHSLQHVESFAATDFANDNPVGPHAQRVFDEIALGNLAPALNIGRPRFKPGYVHLLELELGGILDGDDALPVADEARQSIQKGRLPAARAT